MRTAKIYRKINVMRLDYLNIRKHKNDEETFRSELNQLDHSYIPQSPSIRLLSNTYRKRHPVNYICNNDCEVEVFRKIRLIAACQSRSPGHTVPGLILFYADTSGSIHQNLIESSNSNKQSNW